MRHTVIAPTAGRPLVAEHMRLNGREVIAVTDGGFLIGRFTSVDDIVAAGIDLTAITLKEKS